MSTLSWMERGLVVGACLLLLNLFSTTVQAAPISGQGTWETTLQGRLETAPGSGVFQAYYDTDLDITWVADANINGNDTWDNQVAWAAGVTIGGVSGWRLSTLDPACGTYPIILCPSGEMGHMYYTTLGHVAGLPGLTNSGPFSNLTAGIHWSGTEVDTDRAWRFFWNVGGQGESLKNEAGGSSAWAVHDGDVFGSVTIEIDIKPGSDPNSINLCSNGAVPIAILGSNSFDVNDVNTDTLRFAEASVKVVGKKDPHSLCSYTDVNGDFISDLVCHFVTTDIAGIDGGIDLGHAEWRA